MHWGTGGVSDPTCGIYATLGAHAPPCDSIHTGNSVLHVVTETQWDEWVLRVGRSAYSMVYGGFTIVWLICRLAAGDSTRRLCRV